MAEIIPRERVWHSIRHHPTDRVDPYAIKKQYVSQLCFYGGVSVQKLLPYGTPREIRDEVKRLMEEVGRGGGSIVAPPHDVPGNFPLENLLVFINTVRDQE